MPKARLAGFNSIHSAFCVTINKSGPLLKETTAVPTNDMMISRHKSLEILPHET